MVFFVCVFVLDMRLFFSMGGEGRGPVCKTAKNNSSVSAGNRSVSSNDFPNLETLVKGIVKEKQPFERLEVKKEDLLKMFSVSRNYKVISLLFLCVLNSVS